MYEHGHRRVTLLVFGAVVAAAAAALIASASNGSRHAVGIMSPASIPRIEIGSLGAFNRQRRPQQPSCQTSIGTFNCYAPSDIQGVYDYPTGRNAPTGAGQTIILVDAYATEYEDATGVALDDDLAAFDSTFNVPAPPGGGVTVIAGPDTGTCDTPDEYGVNCSGDPGGWAGEISLDVEYAHAMAPGAKLVVASAFSDSNADINAAEAAVLPHYPGAIVSQSFGGDEAGDYADPEDEAAMHAIFVAAAKRGDTLVASAGDWGASNADPYIMAAYPASDPLVLAVGGTQGLPYPNGLWRNGRYGNEEVWNEPQFVTPGLGPAAGGGAPSVVWNAPPWQIGLTQYSSGRNPMRTEPDVSYDAAVEGGVLTVTGGDVYISGGTSAGSPQWAAIIALADQVRAQHGRPGLGIAAPAIYGVARNPRSYEQDFHDVTVGNNAQGTGDAPLHHGDLGFNAGRGYDIPTGLGTPDVSNLIGDLAGGSPGGFPSFSYGGPSGGGHGRNHNHFTPGGGR
jgi:subtilase family serine protease